MATLRQSTMAAPTQPSPDKAAMPHQIQKLEQLREFTLGMQAAFFTVMGALISTHPDPKTLRAVLELYRQRELAYIEDKELSKPVLDAFLQMWTRVDAESLHSLKMRQQQHRARSRGTHQP